MNKQINSQIDKQADGQSGICQTDRKMDGVTKKKAIDRQADSVYKEVSEERNGKYTCGHNVYKQMSTLMNTSKSADAVMLKRHSKKESENSNVVSLTLKTKRQVST